MSRWTSRSRTWRFRGRSSLPTRPSRTRQDANMVQFNHIVVDSSPAPIATFLNGFVQVVSFFGAQHSADTNGLPPLTSGGIISGLYAIGSQFPFGQNFWIQETAADSGFGNFPYVYTPQIFPNGNGSTIAYEQTITPSSAVVNSGGSLTVGAHIYYVTPIWPPASNEGAPGASISATTTSGNQTVAVGWTALSAPGVCYNVYRDGARRNNSRSARTHSAIPELPRARAGNPWLFSRRRFAHGEGRLPGASR